MALRDSDKHNFETLTRAVGSDDVVLVESRLAKSGEYVALIAATQRAEDSDEVEFIPLAEMIRGNPFEKYLDPTNDDLPAEAPPEDWSQDADAQEWLNHVKQDMAPKMKDSAILVSLCPPDAGDPKFWVELGAAICMGKPIAVVKTPDTQVPGRLADFADEVIEVDDLKDAGPAVMRFMERHP